MWAGEICCVREQIVLLGADRPMATIAPMHYQPKKMPSDINGALGFLNVA